jgi:hypothetical protein
MTIGQEIFSAIPSATSKVSRSGINHHCGPTEGRFDESNSPLDARAITSVRSAIKIKVAR